MRMLLALGLLLGCRLAAADDSPPPKTIDARPNANPKRILAPAGTTFGPGVAQQNVIPNVVQNPPHSPTPRGFPLGAPGGSMSPAGPGFSGMVLAPHF